MAINYSRTNFPSSARFLRVTGEDGAFFVAVNAQSQIAKVRGDYEADGYEVSLVRRQEVPPCRFLYFDVPGVDFARDVTWDNGSDFYFD